MIFSYLILCDLFPLYDTQSESCSISTDAEKTDETQPINNNASGKNMTIPYGLQKRDGLAFEEYLLLVWVSTLLCEEIRQLFSEEAVSPLKKIANYFKQIWNQLDALSIILFYVGFILRVLPSAKCFCAARIVFSIDITLWFIRTLYIFAAIRRLGPKLLMIGEMINDLKFFMVMLTVFIMGFGVSSYSLIYGTQEFSWHLPRQIINIAYWEIFGELRTLDLFEKNYVPTGYALFLLLVTYMAIVSILLVNLLIAMLSNIFDRFHTDTDRIWKFQRYELICEYLTRPALPPPFIIIVHLWRLALLTLSNTVGTPFFKNLYQRETREISYSDNDLYFDFTFQ